MYRVISIGALALAACSAPTPDADVGELEQPIFSPHGGGSSRTVGFSEVANSPYNGNCLGPDVGGYTCIVPFPSWWANDGAGWWNSWRYFDPEDFNAIAAGFNSWLGNSAGTNGLADAWTTASGNIGSMTMSFENDTSDDQFIVHAIVNENLAGVAPSNQTLLIHQSLRLRTLEDGGTLAESPAHLATFQYGRILRWEVDLGTLGQWIGQNCATTACRRNAVRKVFTIMFLRAQGAPLEGAIENSDLLAPYILPGGPPASMFIDNSTRCLMNNFSYGSSLTTLVHADVCDYSNW